MSSRFHEVLQSQGLPVTQPVTMLTDGGDSVRALAGELSPGAVTILDWFHIAMRLTGLEQYVKESIKIRGVTWPALRKAGRLELVSH
jgi:hypothetical protein